MTVRDGTLTRIPSNFSRLFRSFTSVSAAAITTGAGSGLPVETNVTVGDPAISVVEGLLGSDDGMNSWTVPATTTEFPTAAAAGGALDVNTKIPSEVFGSASALTSGVCKKNPLVLTPVTIPLVVTALPANGDVAPLP